MNKINVVFSVLFLIIIAGGGFYALQKQSESRMVSNPPKESASPVPATTVKIGVLDTEASYSEVVASQKEIFKKYNLNVEVQKLPSNIPSLLVGKQLDMACIGSFGALEANIEGANLITIGTILADQPFVLVSTKKPQNIKSVGVPRAGGEIYFRANEALNVLKINPKDITFQALGTNQVRIQAILDKKVDAIAIRKSSWESFAKANNLSSDEYMILVDSESNPDIQQSTKIITRKDFLDNNPQVVENFAKAIIETTAWMSANSEESAKIITQYYDSPAGEADIAIGNYLKSAKDIIFAPDIDSIKSELAFLDAQNPKAKDYQFNNFIDSQIAEDLKQSGFLAQYGFK